MKIAGIIKNSFIDYPGQIAAVVFAQGCNYDCFFCHNRALIPHTGDLMSEDEIFEFLGKRRGLLDAVVVSGGEPTLQPDLKEFIVKIKTLGFLVKLDTNGSRPDALGKLIGEGLLDYVAMDFKAPFERYHEICCVNCDTDAVKQSINILGSSDIMYELRTTLVPQLNETDIENMLKSIAPISTFAIQHYKKPDDFKAEHRFLLNADENDETVYQNAAETAKKHIANVILR